MKYIIFGIGKYVKFETEYNVSLSKTEVSVINDNNVFIVKRYLNSASEEPVVDWTVIVKNDEVRILALDIDWQDISNLIEDLKEAGIEVEGDLCQR